MIALEYCNHTAIIAIFLSEISNCAKVLSSSELYLSSRELEFTNNLFSSTGSTLPLDHFLYLKVAVFC